MAVATRSTLRSFIFERVLNEDPTTRTCFILGTLPDDRADSGRSQAVLKVERTPLDAEAFGRTICSDIIGEVELQGSTDIYSWMTIWLDRDATGGESVKGRRPPDFKVTIIFPATDVHVRKYTRQEVTMVRETPDIYQRFVRPYIDSFPESRTQWVKDILSGISEPETILYSCPDFLILPDMKWDSRTVSALYLVAIARDRELKSLRDLKAKHLGMLNAIRREAEKIVNEKYEKVKLRMFVHYPPSYYHFHVHIVNANTEAMAGMVVGQAHLLDDVVSLIELDGDIFGKITLTYGLGDQHRLHKLFTQNADQCKGHLFET